MKTIFTVLLIGCTLAFQFSKDMHRKTHWLIMAVWGTVILMHYL